MEKRFTLIGALYLVVSLSGCATVVNGRTQEIGISSSPPGAYVTVDDRQRVITPTTVSLSRDESHTLFFKKEGYEDNSIVLTSGTSGWVWGNVLAGGIIGGAVDFATGAARKLSDDAVHVTLIPLPTAQNPNPKPIQGTIVSHEEPSVGQVGIITPNESEEAFPVQNFVQPTASDPPQEKSISERLIELRSLYDQQLLTQEEYEQRREAILKEL